jgi:hypothetical protein
MTSTHTHHGVLCTETTACPFPPPPTACVLPPPTHPHSPGFFFIQRAITANLVGRALATNYPPGATPAAVLRARGALRAGSLADLNVWVVGPPEGGGATLGSAQQLSATLDGGDPCLDGVVVSSAALPGLGPNTTASIWSKTGAELVHQVGKQRDSREMGVSPVGQGHMWKATSSRVHRQGAQ